jgi:phosphohistidine swiveling domain-containing protein
LTEVTDESTRQYSDPVSEEGEPGHFWTRTNAGEASPGVLTPLAWTLWRDQLELAMRQAFCDIGLLDPEDVHVVTTTDERMVGCFFGRAAANVDHVRAYFDRMPSTSGADWEEKMQSSLRGEAVVASSHVTIVERDVSDKWEELRRDTPQQLAVLRTEQHDWWRRTIAEDSMRGPEGARERFGEAVDRFRRAMRLHARQRYLMQSAHSQVAQLAKSLERPDLEMALMSGYGGMEETQVAVDLWRVSRGELTMDAFLELHGYHGPGEGAIHNPSWREDPRPVELTAQSYRLLDEAQHPERRAEAVGRARAKAEAEALALLPRDARMEAVDILRYVREGVVATTIGKATFLMAIDAARSAARSLGRGLAAEGAIEEPDDVFFLTVEELQADLPDDVKALVAFRRARHADYLRFALPESWISPAPAVPIDHWPEDDLDSDVFAGTPASPGSAQGPARVITDPSEQEVQPGEVLVAEVTDPSWVAVMMLAEALVVDVGGPASHAAIVARELGLPCIVNTRNATRRIRTGDVIRVDGDAGIIEILERVGP